MAQDSEGRHQFGIGLLIVTEIYLLPTPNSSKKTVYHFISSNTASKMKNQIILSIHKTFNSFIMCSLKNWKSLMQCEWFPTTTLKIS